MMVNRWIVRWGLGAVLVGGCAGTGEFSEPADTGHSSPRPQDSAALEAAAVSRTPPARGSLDETRANMIASNFNLTIRVANPGKAVDHARKLVTEAGGEVTNAERNLEYGSLNAVLPRHASERILVALRAFGEVTNASQGRNDMRAAMHEAHTRLQRLDLAETTLQEVIRASDDRAVVDALLLALELNRREADSARQQSQAYRDQGRGDQLYVSFNVGAPPNAPLADAVMIAH